MKSFRGKYNSLEEHGTLIRNPNFLLRRKGSKMEYGTFRAPTDDHFSFLVYRTSDTNFGKIQEQLVTEEPEIEVITREKRCTLKFQYDGWDVIEVEEYKAD